MMELGVTVRLVTIAVGLVALGGGILNIMEFIRTKGAIVCEIQGEESRKRTMNRMERIVRSPYYLRRSRLCHQLQI
ncbi:MAG: hypothetical protein PHI12_04140 [Dehalococcoidales bacterium]|nr:hypothetical protein [Dehalococcoidales bacterium]